jgi:hypothetical protein
VTRRQLLEQIDRPALKSLPVEPYVFSEWRTCRVGNARVRRGLIQLAWRFLLFQKESVLAQWFRARTEGVECDVLAANDQHGD